MCEGLTEVEVRLCVCVCMCVFVIIAQLSCLGSDLGQVLLKLTLVTRLELHFEFYF